MTGERGTAADIRIVFIILYFIKGERDYFPRQLSIQRLGILSHCQRMSKQHFCVIQTTLADVLKDTVSVGNRVQSRAKFINLKHFGSSKIRLVTPRSSRGMIVCYVQLVLKPNFAEATTLRTADYSGDGSIT